MPGGIGLVTCTPHAAYVDVAEVPERVRELQAAQQGSQQGVKWFLVIGQDQYTGFHTWHGWQELMGLVTLAIANRPDVAPTADPAVLRDLAREETSA